MAAGNRDPRIILRFAMWPLRVAAAVKAEIPARGGITGGGEVVGNTRGSPRGDLVQELEVGGNRERVVDRAAVRLTRKQRTMVVQRGRAVAEDWDCGGMEVGTRRGVVARGNGGCWGSSSASRKNSVMAAVRSSYSYGNNDARQR